MSDERLLLDMTNPKPRVEVPDPGGIFERLDYLRSKANQQPDQQFVGLTLSEVRFPWTLFYSEHTFVVLSRENQGWLRGISTELAMKRGPSPFFTKTEVGDLTTSLENKGLDSHYNFGSEQHMVDIFKDGDIFRLHLGFTNRAASLLDRAQLALGSETDPGMRGMWQKIIDVKEYREMQAVKRGDYSNRVTLELLQDHLAEVGSLPLFGAEQPFAKAVRIYAEVYSRVLRSLYEVKKVTPPDIVIRLSECIP